MPGLLVSTACVLNVNVCVPNVGKNTRPLSVPWVKESPGTKQLSPRTMGRHSDCSDVRRERSTVTSNFPSSPPFTNSSPVPPSSEVMLPLATFGLGRRILRFPLRPNTLHGVFVGPRGPVDAIDPVDQSRSRFPPMNGAKPTPLP